MQQVLQRWRLRGSADPRSAPHRVLVGVDESRAGSAALCWAAGEASRRGALLTAARAIPAPEVVPAVNDQLWWETGRRLRDAVCAVTGPQAAETLVLEGDPAGELVDLSEETGLLVLGKSSRARHRPVAGSITRYCLLHAHCPVVLVPEEASPGFSAPALVGQAVRRSGGRARMDGVTDQGGGHAGRPFAERAGHYGIRNTEYGIGLFTPAAAAATRTAGPFRWASWAIRGGNERSVGKRGLRNVA